MATSTQGSIAELEGWQSADGAGRVVDSRTREFESQHGWSC